MTMQVATPEPAQVSRKGRRPVRIGKYQVVQHIATGGMGAIYRALDVELERPVALKVLARDLAAKPLALQRFRREARSAARLRHPNVVAVYDVGEDNGMHYIAMEFVDGIDLLDYISHNGKLDAEEARLILIQAARALEHAHQQGIVHRDIKPSNFLIVKKGGKLRVKLTDMGLARCVRDDEFRLTEAGTTLGTVDYMSPEQARDGNSADIRSDIYSLGCTFYHMLAGNAPFARGTLGERITQHFEVKPPDVRNINKRVPEGLALIVAKMLEKKPADRYQTPAELLKDLENPERVEARANSGERRALLEKLADGTEPAGPAPQARAPYRPKDTKTTKPRPTVPSSAKAVPAPEKEFRDPPAPVEDPPEPPLIIVLQERGTRFLRKNWLRLVCASALAVAAGLVLVQLFTQR